MKREPGSETAGAGGRAAIAVLLAGYAIYFVGSAAPEDLSADPATLGLFFLRPACAVLMGAAVYYSRQGFGARLGALFFACTLGLALQAAAESRVASDTELRDLIREVDERGGPRSEDERWLYEYALAHTREMTPGAKVASFFLESIPQVQAFLLAAAVMALARRRRESLRAIA